MQAFVYKGKTLLSGIDPAGRAEKTADAVSVSDKTLYFCPSPVYGYGLERFLSRLDAEAPGSAVLCVEADSGLYDLSINSISGNVSRNARLRITNICDSANLCGLVRKAWGERRFRRVEILRLTGGWQLFPDVYDSLCDALRNEIAVGWSNAMTLTKFGRLYIRNMLRNLSLIGKYHSVDALSFGEAPVLVLGAGPSLDETLDALKKYFPEKSACPQDRLFRIICVDTCLGALKDRNIVPDLAVILESQHWNLRDFIGVRGWKIYAAFDLCALPSSARLLDGQFFLFSTPWTQLNIFKRLKDANLLPAVFPPLGSVGLTAVELARRLTSGKIICAGLDFSFTLDKYHARSTPGHRGKLNALTRFKSFINSAVFSRGSSAAVSKSKLNVTSSPIMNNYRSLFEQEFSRDSRIFDIEGSGLPLGVTTLTMDDAVMKLGGGECEAASDNCAAAGDDCLITNDKTGAANNERESIRFDKDILKTKLEFFLNNEILRLEELRNILTGEIAADEQRLSLLIDECDYLWAHFPDYAGGSSKPDLKKPSAVSFLKRVRAEIDSMIKAIN
ncbi:MAG: DUF115 domain-containing protein [Treponema sp.]|nr:DUF115 domain-containing protein [Treponema sp.]